MQTSGYPLTAQHIERFWLKVEKTETCWLWRGGTTSHGYGQVYITREWRAPAHRVSYQINNGPIPDGLEIDHLCRVRACVNPEHLEPVTHRVNDLRGIGAPAANAVKTHCPRGHALAGHNLYVNPNSGHRRCRLCQQEQNRRTVERRTRERATLARHYAGVLDELEGGERVSAEEAIRAARGEREARKLA